jgi:hypothetical protein
VRLKRRGDPSAIAPIAALVFMDRQAAGADAFGA